MSESNEKPWGPLIVFTLFALGVDVVAGLVASKLLSASNVTAGLVTSNVVMAVLATGATYVAGRGWWIWRPSTMTGHDAEERAHE